MNGNSSSRGQTNWKDKYLDALDEHEKRERKHQQLMALLTRGILRISMIAEGIDSELDKQLNGLRQKLREGSPSNRDLNLVVDALEGQVKRIDTVKSERAKVISQAFQSLVSQLQTLKPEKEAGQQLKRLNKSLKTRSGKIQEYSSLINDYAEVQQGVLDETKIRRVSKPFWHQWVNETVKTADRTVDEVDQSIDQDQQAENKKTVQDVSETAAAEPLAKAGGVNANTQGAEGLDLAVQGEELPETIDPDSVGEEPPFARLNKAICEVLAELLVQIEPPPMARENYKAAKQQIEKGLNWYELVPVLEDISIIVISAFDNNQKDFESFLNQLNDRLSEAYAFISASGQLQGEGFSAGRELSETMREQVTAIQQSVAEARELDQLKNSVSQRLDQIVAAMDKYQVSEDRRESSLSEQLDALVERVKLMESASASAEQRIEEQRQKALRDVLTQLPNREAYQQRLEQEFERWQRYDRPLTMVVCDVDHFKRINDTYGHLAGDKVLRIIAKTLRKRLRKTDFVARFGGEEFVALLPETDQAAAYKVVEGVREAIANCPFHFKDKPVKITMSFGISGFVTEDNAEQVFARCDRALYQAKDQGRNQSVLAGINEAGDS